MKFATLPRILRRRLQTSTSQSTKSLRLPRETHHFGASSNPPRLPTFFATLTNSCACHVFYNVSKSLHLPRETQFEPPKTPRDRQFLTSLTSKLLSRPSVVQFLSGSTSKTAPNMPVFNDFDFRIALARRRGANFVDILGSRSFAPPRFSDLPLRTFEATKLWKNTAFRAIPTRQNLSCLASVL